MKKLLRTGIYIFPFLVFLLYVLSTTKVQSSSFQPPTGRSQDPVNNSTCAASGCHNTWSPFSLERAIITIGTTAQNQQPINGFEFTPGTQYLINFSVVGTASRYGFQMTALRGNSMAGTFSLINTNNTSLSSPQNGISYVGHRSASGSVSSWSFNWTAPSTGTGNITFYTAVNKAYSPTGDSNDSIFHRTYTITQAVVQPPIVQTNNDTAICNGASVQLNTNATNAQGTVTYSWSPAAGLSCTNCANPTASPSTTTTYIVTANANNGIARDTVTITVNSLPNAAIAGNNFVCAGSSITLTASGGNTYSWNQGLGTGAAKNVSPTVNTNYSVTVTNNFNCTAVASKTVDVRNNSSEILNRSICQGGSFFFKGQNIAQAGTFLDTLVNAAGCDSFITLNLSIKSVVRDTLNRSICQGESVLFKGIPRTTAGVYQDTSVALGGCDSISVLVLLVNDTPSNFSIIQNGNQLAASPSFASYKWFLNGTEISGAADSIFMATQSGNYELEVRNAEGCFAKSSIVNVTISGIGFNASLLFRYYPNPVREVLVVEQSNATLNAIQVFDLAGSIVDVPMQYAQEKFVMDVSGLKQGMYMLKIQNGREAVVQRFFKN